MYTTTDVVFCFDYTSSMTCDFVQSKNMALHILDTALASGRNDARFGLVKFRSCNDSWKIRNHGFTQHRNIFRQWLHRDQPEGGSQDGYEAVGDALHEALHLGWRTNSNNEVFTEKLVILITDGAPDGLFTELTGKDPWIMSNKFNQQDITLVVVGAGLTVIECDDFYCALAQNTGGEYIPLVNAARILSDVIESVISEEDTFRQALRHVIMEEIEINSSFKYSAMEHRVDGIIKDCETMTDIRKLYYNHRRFS